MTVAPGSHRPSVFPAAPRGLFFALTLAAALFASPARPGEDAEFQKAKGYYTLQEYKDAIVELTKFIAAYPKSDRLEDTKLLLAESHYQLKDYANAAKSYGTFVTEFPQSARRADALQRALMSYSIVKDYANCLKHAQLYIDENRAKFKAAPPQDPIAIKFATALYRAGDASYEINDFAKAKTFWEELTTEIPKSPLVAETQDGLGWIYFSTKEFDKAATAFHATADVPKYKRAAWAKLMEGRALAAANKPADALAAIKLVPTLDGYDKNLEAEMLIRSAELLLRSPKLAEAGDPSETLKPILEQLHTLAKDFPTLPATLTTVDLATFRMIETKHNPEAAELASVYLELTAANPAAAPKRSAMARIKARALLAANKNAEAIDAARAAVKDADALTDAAAKNEERPASLMLLQELVPAEAPAILKDIVDHHPQTRFAYDSQYELARIAGEAGHVADALTQIQALLDALSKAPANQPGLDKLKCDALFAAGHFAFHKPDHAKSVEFARAFQKTCGDKDARADDVARKLGWSLLETGDAAGAITALDAALAGFPKSTYRDEMLYVCSLAASKTGNSAAALNFDETLARDFPASTFVDDALFDAAVILFKQNKYEPCLAKLDTLLGKAAVKPELKNVALQLRASTRLQLKQFPGALADADALLKAPNDPRISLPALRFIRAMALLSTPEKEPDALAAFDDLIAKGPADAPEVRQGISRRAFLLFKNKKYAEAKTDFLTLSDPAKAASPADAQNAALHLAVIHRELKETPQAKALLEKLVTQPLEGMGAFEAPFQLGNILFEAGDNAGAIKQYEAALSHAATATPASHSAARLNLAWSLRRGNEKEKAQSAFAEVVKADANGAFAPEALFERARLMVEMGKTAEALPLWKEIQTRFADSTFAEKALFLQGQAQAQASQFKEAAESFAAHASTYPAVNLRETLCGLAESRLHLNELDKAREAFEKVLGPKGIEAELEDVNERALLGLAEIALKAGDAAGSKKMVLRILTENAVSPWADAAYFISGQACEVLKEPEKAIGYYRKLIAERPKSSHVPAAEERLRSLGAPK